MLHVTLRLTLTLKAPLLTQSSEAGKFGLDAVMARTADGEFCFPRKLIKGCLRQAWAELKDAAGEPTEERVRRWLGAASEEKTSPASSVDPVRGRLAFGDFVTPAVGGETITRVKVDAARDAVDEGALQVIEAPFAPGEAVPFTGQISYFAADEDEHREISKWVVQGLRWVTNLGALENVNFGRLVKVESDRGEIFDISSPPTGARAKGCDYLDVVVRPLGPFCIAKRRAVKNLFESEKVIPGGVLKGTFAATWLALLGGDSGEIEDGMDDRRPELCRWFSAVRFTHAFPAPAGAGARPTQPPLSLVKVGKDGAAQLYDVALMSRPGLIGGQPAAPSFFMDWKSRDDVDRKFGWADPRTRLQVQTKIKDNRAEAGMLYAYETVVPEGVEWYGRIDLRGVEPAARAEVEGQLRSVLGYGLHGVGKTKAVFALGVRDGGTVVDWAASDLRPFEVGGNGQKKQRWAVTLQTPALLCDPGELDEASGAVELRAAYALVWSELSGDTVKLSHYFAGQSLAGGEYLYQRFQYPNPYNPYLLTDAGSVFVLEAEDGREAEASDRLRDWVEKGLPLSRWAAERFRHNGKAGDHWANCPYSPENGYGEVAVNLRVHWENAPKDGEYHEIS